ncbi:MAG: hypothetical protein KDB63_23030 [Nocardioidaceae bacterium]|nr:hypothetical protein [Nocardioidaceae bacterium]
MTTATVEVPHRDIPRFEYWLASQCQDSGVELSEIQNHGGDLVEEVRNAATKFAAVRQLMEQVEKAKAGEVTTVSGDPQVLLWQCQAITLDYASPITDLDTPGNWDFKAAAETVDSLAHWIEQGKNVQAAMH